MFGPSANALPCSDIGFEYNTEGLCVPSDSYVAPEQPEGCETGEPYNVPSGYAYLFFLWLLIYVFACSYHKNPIDTCEGGHDYAAPVVRYCNIDAAPTDAAPGTSEGGLSGGAIAALVLVPLAIVGVAAAGWYWVTQRSRQRRSWDFDSDMCRCEGIYCMDFYLLTVACSGCSWPSWMPFCGKSRDPTDLLMDDY